MDDNVPSWQSVMPTSYLRAPLGYPNAPPTAPLPPTPVDNLIEECAELSPLGKIGPEEDSVCRDDRRVINVALARHAQRDGLPEPFWLANDSRLVPGHIFPPQSSLDVRYHDSNSPKFSRPIKRTASLAFDQEVQQQDRAAKWGRSEVPLKPTRLEEEEEDIVYGTPHQNLGCNSLGKHSCSCGKTYTRAERLRSHVDAQRQEQRHLCSLCGKAFTRQDIRRRHEEDVCRKKKVACPGCKQEFRKDYLRVHLANKSNFACRIMVEALHVQASGESEDTPPGRTHHYWTGEDGHLADATGTQQAPPPMTTDLNISAIPAGLPRPVRSAAPNLAGVEVSNDIKVSPTPEDLVKTLLKPDSIPVRPIHRRTREPCDLCGALLGPDPNTLISHISRHMSEFADRNLRCENCIISFAHQKDLDIHLQAASKGHCGFNFDHTIYRGCASECTGHHPPPDIKSSCPTEHVLMRNHLWAWELCQLKAHRVTVVRLLAERLMYTQASRTSLSEQELDCMAAVSRFSQASFESFHSVPAHVRFQDIGDVDELATDLASLMSDYPANAASPIRSEVPEQARPESLLFPTRLKPPSKQSPFNSSPLPVISMQSSYVDRLHALRKPQSIVQRPPSIRKAASRYLFSLTSQVQEIEYVAS